MADLHEPDVGTAYYRSTDAIKNIRFSVKLERVTSSSIIPQTGSNEAPKVEGDEMEMKDLSKQAVKDKEEVIIEWQQKVFSQREIELYSREENCVNPVDKKYHNEVRAILEKSKPTNRVFTYVDHDRFSLEGEGSEFLTSSPNERPSFLAEKMTTVRRRRVGGTKQRRDKDRSFVPKLNVVEENPSDELLLKNHMLSAPVQVMHIMGDLSPRERMATDDDEAVLCTIQLDANGVVCIHPDFNRGRQPYIVETTLLGKEVFEYTIEHASKEMNRQEHDREMKMYREVYSRHKDFLQACVGTDFEMPPLDVLRLLAYGEIETAKNFEYDEIYLHFFVDLPKNWTAEHHQQLSWVTQTCISKVEGRDDVCYFSFPFNFELFYKNESRKEDDEDELPHFPTILIEVLSLDQWNRFRTEGYTYLTVPSHPGCYRHKLHCWRPIGGGIISELRRFFIGGSPELEDPTYTAVPSTFQGSHLSKFAFRTESTGEINVKLNVMMQSRAFKDKKASRKTLGTLLDTLGINAVQKNITNVLDAFKKARQRMLQARENATKDLMKTTTKTAVA